MKEFFLNAYEKFIHLSWVEWTITFCKNNPLMAGIIGGCVLFIIVVLCVIGSVSRKSKKAAKLAAATTVETPMEPPVEQAAVSNQSEAPIQEQPPIAEEPMEEKADAPIGEVVEEVAEPETAVENVEAAKEIEEEPIAEEQAEEVKEEPVAEPLEETPAIEELPAEETVEESPAIEEVAKTVVEEAPVVEEVFEEIVEEAPAEDTPIIEEKMIKEIKEKKQKKKPVTPPTEIGETIALIEKMDDSVPSFLRDHYEEGEMDKIARYTGKWSICRVLTDAPNSEEMYFFELRASNGEKLLSSEEYTTYQGALRGIETHRANILNGNIKMSITKKGDYIFKVLSGKNMLLCLGQNYPTMVKCQKAITSTKRFAETAILDENVQDIVIKVPQEENTPLPTFPEGSIGKWIIFSRELAGGTIYFFELFANNGERLLSSESYTTYIGAINGIQTYKNNIQKNNFRISLTKRGDYIYKLLNANNQLLCLGEHYKTKRLCENAVESVKRFALTSPVLTEDKK